jgi:hypothetical protein
MLAPESDVRALAIPNRKFSYYCVQSQPMECLAMALSSDKARWRFGWVIKAARHDLSEHQLHHADKTVAYPPLAVSVVPGQSAIGTGSGGGSSSIST